MSTVTILLVAGGVIAGAGGGAAVAPLRRRFAHSRVRAAGAARPQQIVARHDFYDEATDTVWRRGTVVEPKDPVLKRHADRFHIE